MDMIAVGGEEARTRTQGATRLASSGTGFTKPTKPGIVWSAVEGSVETAQDAPLRVYERPALLPSAFGALPARLELEATGAFSIYSHLLRDVMWDRPGTRVVLADLVDALEEIEALEGSPEGRSGVGAAAPDRAAVRKATSWLEQMYEDVMTTSGTWFAPSVVADAFGNVVFEWWEGDRKLTVYVTPTVVEYVKVWGPDMFSDMEDGYIEGAEGRQALWRWLMG